MSGPGAASGGRVGFAVCTYRRPEGLARLLAILPATIDGARLPVIVVDNEGGNPRVAAVLARAAERLHLRAFVETRPGISAARERAVAEAEAAGITLLALLDDDEWPSPGWLDALLARQRETGAAVVGGVVEPRFIAGAPEARLHPFWAVRPQARRGRAFVHATSNVLLDLAQLRDVPRPLFDPACGLSGGGDLLLFSDLFALGKSMAWAEAAVAFEAIPLERADFAWLRRRRFRVGNHMVMDETRRLGAARAFLKTVALCLRLPVYPLLAREPGAALPGWRLEASKLAGRLAAHRGLRAFDYARDGILVRRA